MSNLPGWYSYDSGGMDKPMQVSEHDKVVGTWCQAVFEEAKDELENAKR